MLKQIKSVIYSKILHARVVAYLSNLQRVTAKTIGHVTSGLT